MKLIINITDKKVTKAFVIIGIALACAALIGDQIFNFQGRFFELSLFKLDKKITISTSYASFLLFMCSILIVTILYLKKKEEDRFIPHWIVLAVIFLGLSLSKMISFHTFVFGLARSILSRIGLFIPSFAVGLTLILIFILFYLNFYKSFQKHIKKIILFAGIIYVGGSITMEVLSGFSMHYYGRQSLLYSIFSNVEELFEMTGAIIFIYALLLYIDIEKRSYKEGDKED